MFPNWRSYYARVQQRWVFAIMAMLSVINANTMKSCLSLTITEMVVEINSTDYADETCEYPSNSTVSKSPKNIAAGVYDWDEELQGMILSSFFWGYIITQLPSGMLAEKFGGKYPLGFGILSTAIFTLLVPFAIDIGGSTALIVLRFLMGLGDGVNLPTVVALISQWAPPSERSKMGTVVLSGSIIGSVVGGSITGILMCYSPLGWRSVFYFFGSSGVLWFIVWMSLCYSTPNEHPFISEKEKKYLHDAMSEHTHKITPPIPWRHIMRSIPFWALVVSLFGQDWCCFTFALDFPKYFSSVLKFSVTTIGLMFSLLALATWIVSLGYSWLADWLINEGKMSRTNVRKLFSTLSTLGTGIFLMAVSYAGCDRVLVLVFFTMAMLSIGTMFPGMRVNSLDLSPNYSGTLLAITSTITGFTGILAPYVVGVLAPNQTATEWRLVFWIIFIIYCASNSVYVFFASGEVQYWNDPEFLKNERDQRNKTDSFSDKRPKLRKFELWST